ncbi:uncharacterized protein LOC128682089 isoform X3 [Plodia interpunctella]|uniref:uncharacterized protein LOC128682089 isoform X3 n=1 Tax=Plodia interpunctella TaxID=58824 RepID=UPI00236818AD|nr:uncharacterized protein LOC128682089 isoform X3 [Plodia interpunctella]
MHTFPTTLWICALSILSVKAAPNQLANSNEALQYQNAVREAELQQRVAEQRVAAANNQIYENNYQRAPENVVTVNNEAGRYTNVADLARNSYQNNYPQVQPVQAVQPVQNVQTLQKVNAYPVNEQVNTVSSPRIIEVPLVNNFAEYDVRTHQTVENDRTVVNVQVLPLGK